MYKIGDEVEWNSSGLEHTEDNRRQWPNYFHRGIIAEVVAAGETPKTYEDKAYGCNSRSQESYVVSVERYNKKSGAKLDTKTYWPPVSRLRLAVG